MKYSNRIVNEYFDFWPCQAVPDKYQIKLIDFDDALSLLSCWRDKAKKNRPISYFAKLINEKDYMGKGHHILAMARNQSLKKPTILVVDGIIWDGNNTMCAFWKRGYRGKVLAIMKDK